MKTIRNLGGLCWSWLSLFLFLACDYYEPLEMPLEKEFTLDTEVTSTGPISNEEPDKITLYKVSGEEIVKIQDFDVAEPMLSFQQDTTKHHEIWALVKKIIPIEFRAKIDELLIYHGASTNTSGFVDPTLNNLSSWQLAIAIDYAYRKPFNVDGGVTFTIIHEFGHILTLNSEQISAGIIEKNCEGYFVSNGCTNANSHLQRFYHAYWQDISEEFITLDKTPEARSLFYSKYKDRFVSPYAATGPIEDIAEVFATFVTETQMPDGTSVVDQKLQMMYDASDLLSVRDYIRQHVLTSKGQEVVHQSNHEDSFNCATRL